MTAATFKPKQNTAVPSIYIPDLISLAVEGLVPMLDSEKLLFCHRIRKDENKMIPEGLSRRYTIMTLLGLHELKKAGGTFPFDLNRIFTGLTNNIDWITNIGDLGLLLWIHSVLRPDQAPDWCPDTHIEKALDHYPDARDCRTMELAWFITGLSHHLLTRRNGASKFANIAMEAYKRIEPNQGTGGFFGHLGRKANLNGLVRGRIGTFADQVYPILALTHLSQACGLQEPLRRALDCAQAICDVQGEMGQWWWHYDSAQGRVLRKYPVYSVHQDGMAPMALFAVGQASGHDFKHSIYKGLQWIAGTNELGEDLRDLSVNTIWRCIAPKHKSDMYMDDLLGLLGRGSHNKEPHDPSILYECRPYHFGWLLYAFSRDLGGSIPGPSHLPDFRNKDNR
jgi:hypothetical protein